MQQSFFDARKDALEDIKPSLLIVGASIPHKYGKSTGSTAPYQSRQRSPVRAFPKW